MCEKGRRDTEEEQGNPHRLSYMYMQTLSSLWVWKTESMGGGMTQTGQTGRQPEEGGKWREKGGKRARKSSSA